jgi:hypothetical protein
MAKQFFGESSRPRRRVRRLVQSFDLAGARLRLPLARAVLEDLAVRTAAVVKARRELQRAAPAARPAAEAAFALALAERRPARLEARRLGLKILPGAAGGAFPTLVNGALAYLVLLREDDDIYAWRYRDEPRLRPIPAGWHAAPAQRALDCEGMPL